MFVNKELELHLIEGIPILFKIYCSEKLCEKYPIILMAVITLIPALNRELSGM